VPLFEQLELEFRLDFRKCPVWKAAGIAELLIPQNLRVDAVRPIVHELAAPADVIALAQKFKDAFPRLWLVRRSLVPAGRRWIPAFDSHLRKSYLTNVTISQRSGCPNSAVPLGLVVCAHLP
jgi:hypothetical protein